VSLQGRLAHFGAPGARRGVRGARPARPPRLVSGTSTSMGGFPCKGCGLGVSNRTNFTYCLAFDSDSLTWQWQLAEPPVLILPLLLPADVNMRHASNANWVSVCYVLSLSRSSWSWGHVGFGLSLSPGHQTPTGNWGGGAFRSREGEGGQRAPGCLVHQPRAQMGLGLGPA
jgi:hypothetical protein